MESTDIDLIDRVALYVSGALMLLGIAVAGIVEILAGPPYGASPATNEAGEIVANPAVDPNIRTGLVMLGLLVLLLWGIYRMAQPQLEGEPMRTPESPAG